MDPPPAYHPRACSACGGFMGVVPVASWRHSTALPGPDNLWLTGWQQPDHNTLWRFYKEHRQAMRRLFKRTVRTAVAMQLVDLAVQAVDGTKVAPTPPGIEHTTPKEDADCWTGWRKQ